MTDMFDHEERITDLEKARKRIWDYLFGLEERQKQLADKLGYTFGYRESGYFLVEKTKKK